MRTTICAVTLIGAALALAPAAEAKLCVRISAPAHVSLGAPAVVTVTTLMPTWEGGKLVHVRPVAALPRVRLALLGPAGQHRTAVLRRVRGRPEALRGVVRFQTTGVWELTPIGWESAPRGCARPARVRVR